MDYADFLVPVLGFLLLYLSIVKSIKEKKEGTKLTHVFEGIIGFCIMCASIIIAANNNTTTNRIIQNSDSSNNRLIELNKKQDIANSQLIDIGIKIDNTTGNIKVVDSQILRRVLKISDTISIATKQDGNQYLPDSLNYLIKLSGENLSISPKQGTWSRAFFSTDYSLSANNKDIVSEGMGPVWPYDSIVYRGKKYTIGTYYIYERAVYPQKPIVLNISGAPNQFIIFGEQGSETKRFIYRQGKCTWYPFK